MTESSRKFFTGRSLEQAVVAAANHYGIHPDEVKYREIEKRHGFVRTRRNAVIAVDPGDVKKSPEERSAERTRPGREERRAEAGREEAPRREPRPPRERDEGTVEPPGAEALEEGRPEGEAGDERGRRRREREGSRRERAPRERRGGRRAEPAPGADREEKPREKRKPSTSGPWWQAEPVTEESEEVEDVPDLPAPEAEAPEPEEGEEPREGERYRFVESSEGLKRRERPGAPVTDRPRGRRGAGRGRDEAARAGAGEAEERRDQRRRGGRRGGGRARGEAPPPPVAAPPLTRLPPRAERLPRAEEELAEAAQDALDRVLEFVGVEAEADFFRNEDRLEVELWGPDDHVLLEDDGQILLAIEHLLPRMLRSLYGDSMPVRVDCDDFHARREERLRAVALEAAEEVRRRGKPRTLDELDPAERRIVHLSLADAEDVRTESFGNGYYKRVKILPA